jgi:hypothetical protein
MKNKKRLTPGNIIDSSTRSQSWHYCHIPIYTVYHFLIPTPHPFLSLSLFIRLPPHYFTSLQHLQPSLSLPQSPHLYSPQLFATHRNARIGRLHHIVVKEGTTSTIVNNGRAIGLSVGITNSIPVGRETELSDQVIYKACKQHRLTGSHHK